MKQQVCNNLCAYHDHPTVFSYHEEMRGKNEYIELYFLVVGTLCKSFSCCYIQIL